MKGFIASTVNYNILFGRTQIDLRIAMDYVVNKCQKLLLFFYFSLNPLLVIRIAKVHLQSER